MVGRTADAEAQSGLNTLAHVGVAGNLSDAQLLDRFLARNGEAASAAFEALVTRHGPMVLDVCRHVLRDHHEAQDAFQAAFLVLASRAGTIRRRDALAGWLLGVARRVALRSRADLARRRVSEGRAAQERACHDGDLPESWPELHEEIDMLPARYREPVVLCYLEGLNTDAAALRLGCPRGTVLSRLSRARERLRGRLIRRGLAPLGGPLTPGLYPDAAPAAIPPGLVPATVRASLVFAEQPVSTAVLVSIRAIALAGKVVYAMTVSKLKVLGAAVLACLVMLYGLQSFARQFGNRGATSKIVNAESNDDAHQRVLMRSEAARRAYEMALKGLSNGGVRDIEVIYRWSRRRMDGQLAASRSRDERITAAEAHLKRMRDLEKCVPALSQLQFSDGERFPASCEAAAKYYRLEAEISLDGIRR
jgi:RNA polymerase sigma factor (sigma-70 family)